MLQIEYFETKISEFTPNLIYKKLYTLSKILTKAGANINLIYKQRNQNIGFAPEEGLIAEEIRHEILQEKLVILTCINEKKPDLENLTEKLEKLRNLQKKLKECRSSKESIIFNGFVEVNNFMCLIEEKLLFSMYAEQPNLNMKFPFINKINEIYFTKKTKDNIEIKNQEAGEENVEIAEIKQSIESYADFNIDMEKKEIDELILSYLSLSHFYEDKINRKRIVHSWIFRYKPLKFEKYIQVLLDWVLAKRRKETLLYEDPILNNSLKFDYEQILDFNFKYVSSYFSKNRWFQPKNEGKGKGQFKNKKKIVRFYNNIIFYVTRFVNSKTNYQLTTEALRYLQVTI